MSSKEMNILLKAKNFTVAAIAHLLNGSPTCTQEEIDYRFSICEKCNFFTGIACADKRCGCNINDQRIYLNKLAWADQSCPQDKWGTPLKHLVTLCITTFRRPDALASILGSIAHFYPDLPKVVVDTRGNLSWGRNYAVKQVNTPYLMLLEDDFVFTEQTNVRTLLQILQEDKELGFVGGAINGAHSAYNFDLHRCTLTQVPATRFRCNKYGQEYVLCNYTDNFGLIRTELFHDVKWDEELEIHEHLNFFYNLAQTHLWRVAVAKDVNIKHDRPRPTPEYKQFRKRNFVPMAQKKLGFVFSSPKEIFTWPTSFLGNQPYKESSDESVSTAEKPSS
jgi:hypothetical protein